MAWSNPKTWFPNIALNASELNQYVRDNFKAIGDPWTAYTPTWTASTTSPVLNNGTISGRYVLAGKWLMFRINITMGSTTTFGSGAYAVSLPPGLAIHATGLQLVHAEAVIGSATYTCRGRISSGTASVLLYTLPATAGTFDRAVTQASPATFASGSSITVQGFVEVA
ncbi:hypothetical protein ACIRN4_16365 [Pimelobacter simplex]|uniref:hypothetical protein n=1 Tax=Nocardioides simplex TaxID=2045 RepID=UPI0037FF2E80